MIFPIIIHRRKEKEKERDDGSGAE